MAAAINYGYLPAKYVPLPEEEGKGVYNENGNQNSDVFIKPISKNCGTDNKDGCWPETIYSPFDKIKPGN